MNICWLLAQIEVKEIFCPANQDSTTGKIWPMLQSVGRGMQLPRPLIPSLTTASGISKLNSSAEQAQSIIKDCQATGLDCSSVCGTIFGGTQRSGQSRAPAAQTIHLTAYWFWLPTELRNKLTVFVASLAKISYFLSPCPLQLCIYHCSPIVTSSAHCKTNSCPTSKDKQGQRRCWQRHLLGRRD